VKKGASKSKDEIEKQVQVLAAKLYISTGGEFVLSYDIKANPGKNLPENKAAHVLNVIQSMGIIARSEGGGDEE
jgi:hypothetical protein